MKRILIIALAALVSCFGLRAQSIDESVGHAGVEAEVDSTLFGRDIFSSLPAGVKVKQSSAVRKALDSRVAANASKTVSGYRIRIYFDSSRNAREVSASVMSRFNSMYPDIQAYRTYSSPNFKVTVGNFRTRVDAEYMLRKLKADFPDAFIVREKFKYPSIGTPHAASEEMLMTL